MESASRNGAVVPPDTAPEVGTVQIVAAATALRWSRPDLTAALAEHLMEASSAVSDRDGWLVAAGLRVHAVGATGDAREVASEVLEELPRWNPDALSGAASQRLRLELAVLAHDAGEYGASGTLLEGTSRDGHATDAAMAAEVASARLRCRRDDGPSDPADALAAWSRVGGTTGETGAAAALLVAAASDRRTGRVGSAVARAVEGLARLDRARTSPHALSPSPHLAAALAAEWIAALIAAGSSDQSREGSRPLRERLVEHARPTRQLALLRLTLARVAAEDAPEAGADAANELERAAQDAAASDAPELEYICRTALGEVHEAGGRLASALESVRLAVVADRRHRSRAVRFRAALAAVPGLGAGDPATGASPSPSPGAGTSGSADPADVGPSGRGAPPATDPSPDHPDRAAAPAGSSDRTAVLRSVQAASMAGPRPVEGSARRGPVEADRGPGRGDGWSGPAVGAGRSSSNGRAATGPTAQRAAANGAGAITAGASPAGPWGDRVNGNGVRPDGTAGTDGNRADGETSGRPGSGTGGGGVDRPGVSGGAVHASAGGAAGVGPEPDATADEADPPVTAPMNPWATGVWTAGPRHAPERDGAASPASRAAPTPAAAPAVDPVPPSPPVRAAAQDPVASALADPDAWLASALADLERIWGRGPDDAGDTAHDGPGPSAAADPSPTGCVVVLDLTRGGERLPADLAASTVRRVARRLARQLPESAHLLRDRADAVSVVLADGDRVAVAEWMHRVVPALVDGLAVDAAVEGANLRAAVHDAQGVVGAQVLQRLDRGRTRSASDGTPGRARHAAPADVTADTATRGETSGQAARDGQCFDDAGSRRPSTSGATDGMTVDEAHDGMTGGDTTGSDRTGSGTRAGAEGAATGDGAAVGRATGGGPIGAAGLGSPGVGSPGVGSPGVGSRRVAAAPVSGVVPPGVATPGAAEPSPPVGDRPRAADGDLTAGPGRHDETGGRRPYLPDGVVVRPGTGGRRHRRSPDPTPDEPESDADPRSPRAQQSTEGLGLADLLAGALAAYRGI